ncbi:hypothetical protein [Puia sp.]|jgi:hypothetical protein|uniref:hypothetical protein n=1 Tax=Puia sp. TaxID=2045100 RepID=UPI002F40B7E9
MIKRALAHFFSIVFHPLFISAYVMAFIIFVHPYAFAGFEQKQKVMRLMTVVLCNTFLPLFAVFLLWRLQLIKSPMLRNEKERIGPYLIAMIFYWWTWLVFKRLPDTPALAVHFLLGTFLAVCGAWICNIYFKVSMHAIALAGATMFFCLFAFNDDYGSGLYVAIALLLTGIVCTSRLILSEHTSFEIWAGVIVGLLTQYIGWQF